MRIKALINGKEITGFWNEKYYKSKVNPEKNVRIYINNVEYDIPKEEFKYEEVLTEKQQKYAWDLKLKFLEKLDEIFEKHKIKKECEETIKEYFKNKEASYFLKNQSHLSPILASIFTRAYLVCSIITKKILDRLEIVKNKGNLPEEKLKELVLKALVYSISNQLLPSNEPVVARIFEDDTHYYVQLNNQYLLGVNKKTDEIDTSTLEMKDKKYIAKLEERSNSYEN